MSGGAPGAPVENLGDLLDVLIARARILAEGPGRPSHIRLEVAGVAMELGWGGHRGGSDAANAANVPAGPGAWWGTGGLPEGNGSGAGPAGRASENSAVAVAAPESTAGAVEVAADHVVTSPMVGTFYRAPEPGAAPFVAEGDLVAVDQQVGLVEAMKLMVPITADRAGRVKEVLCANAEAVEFGTPLLSIVDAAS